jgi:hypothetical protein
MIKKCLSIILAPIKKEIREVAYYMNIGVRVAEELTKNHKSVPRHRILLKSLEQF